ncbi:MAG: GNAT family N-acetyltransferase [Fimbriimonadaceae bacterium]|nr:GNAT family N-acetyltransferase [Fimbriimonadaceae bacterium]
MWDHLAEELGAGRAELTTPGIHLTGVPPRPRPYLRPPAGLLTAFHCPGCLTVAAAPGFVGFAHAWLHHCHDADGAAQPEGLRWLRGHLDRGGARLLSLQQYALFRGDTPPATDPRVRLLQPADGPLLQSELGWGEEQTAEWLGRGVYGAFLGDRLACRVTCFRINERVAEIGVRTLPEFRGQGLATHTVQHAATALLAEHHAVLYTCGTENEASLAVAQHLGAHHCGDLLVVVGQQQHEPA